MEAKFIKKCIWPPDRVLNMKQLDRELFQKMTKVPFILTSLEHLPTIRSAFKLYLLKMPAFKPIQKYNDEEKEFKIILNPDQFNDNVKKIIDDLYNSDKLIAVNNEIINYENLQLTYENFNHITIFRSIFQDDSLTGFSTIGHIIHLNLRDHLIPYKTLIGQVLLDKIKGCRLVVNKLDIIDSKFRNFQMEILAQDKNEPKPTTVVTTLECDVRFKLDFAKVYWNPRLSAERTRMMRKFHKEVDIIYDVFAGVGPFAVTAAKLNKCRALANDLNPESYKWLCENVKINKVDHLVKCYNLDGRDFIRTEIKNDLIDQIKNFNGSDFDRKFHVLMNLPEIAWEFLDEFNGLLSSIKDENHEFEIVNMFIHCYLFLKNVINPHDHITQLISSKLGYLPNEDIEIFEVRKVAPNKLMYRISFRLNTDVLYGRNGPTIKSSIETNHQGIITKRLKIE